MKKIVFLNVFLFIHAISAMEATLNPFAIQKQNYADNLLFFYDQVSQEVKENILHMISRLADQDDINAVEEAESFLYMLQFEAEIKGEESTRAFLKTEQEMNDEKLARALDLALREEASMRSIGKLNVKPLAGLIDRLRQISSQNNFDFDVHILDSFVTPNWNTIVEYLNQYTPITGDDLQKFSANIYGNFQESEIYKNFRKIIEDMPPEELKNHDLNLLYLNDAFNVLRQGQHRNLVPQMVQVYSLIQKYAPDLQKQHVVMFISNVNKFKGAKCFLGYRNRLVTALLQFAYAYGTRFKQII
ncbi:MAG: hypothetical protein LBF44_00985 [Holosporaceae bacterium]|jgi:hypothetical protein|nr:hypothetical protein [Holosporaceae bacterium]